jgi:hypothetical protein
MSVLHSEHRSMRFPNYKLSDNVTIYGLDGTPIDGSTEGGDTEGGDVDGGET